jgi:ubiquitin carboxyl-terminal hydrolase 25/28
MVSLRILSPLLNTNFVQTLTDVDAVRKRADEAIAANPDRLEGMTGPLPITVLDNLRIYLNNSLHNKELNKDISAINKRFMLAFGLKGAPCREVLEFLGFTYLV